MPAKAPTWMIRSFEERSGGDVRSTASASALGVVEFDAGSASATANSSPLSRAITASLPELASKGVGDRLEQPVACLISMLVVDRLEAVNLEGNDDRLSPARQPPRITPCMVGKPLRL